MRAVLEIFLQLLMKALLTSIKVINIFQPLILADNRMHAVIAEKRVSVFRYLQEQIAEFFYEDPTPSKKRDDPTTAGVSSWAAENETRSELVFNNQVCRVRNERHCFISCRSMTMY